MRVISSAPGGANGVSTGCTAFAWVVCANVTGPVSQP
jgi:hypothetical protein